MLLGTVSVTEYIECQEENGRRNFLRFGYDIMMSTRNGGHGRKPEGSQFFTETQNRDLRIQRRHAGRVECPTF
jgi:hypothetical protein